MILDAKMCARLLSCPLCSQPGFVTLDALRAGLVSVATRPLACPVCDETLLGIDKLTIHLFGHTINANNRSEARKDVNCDDSAMILPQNWGVRGTRTVVSNGSQSGERDDEKIGFASLSNLNLSRSVAAVINKETAGSQGCSSVSETMEKSQNEIMFVQNMSQQQQFCSSSLIRTDDSTNVSNTEAYRVPMMLDRSLEKAREQNLSQPTNGTHIYQKNIEKNSKTAAQKEETIAHFSDTWIANLLHEDDEKSSTKGSSREEKSQYSMGSERISNLPNEEENYRPSTSIRNVNTEILNNVSPLNRLDSTDPVVPRAEEIFSSNQQTNLNSKVLLPQWKAFRLLAMKEKTERCDICGIHFPDVNFLVLHKQLAHMIPEKDVNASPEELLKNCPCHLCTKVFKTRGTLMVHMRVAHMGYNLGFLSKDKESESVCCENGFNCPTCGKNFKKEQHVTQHLKTHEGKQWECDVCSKMFTTKYFLKKHKRLHSGEMPYKCTICDKTFTFQQSFHKHRLYHKDDKPHTCSTCGRSFKELSTLHNHERIHTGEKPFACETCGKCFRQRVSYLVHRRIHTGVMPYKCTICGKSFRYKVSQRTHKCPAQSEDTGSIAPETSTSNIQSLPSSSCADSSTIPKTEIFLQNQSLSDLAANENNKFILIVNTQGQPILTREADAAVASCYLNEKRCTEQLERNHKGNQDNGNDFWNQSLSRENVSKESVASSRRECPLNEKLSTDDTRDFFSLVMSPMENDVSSPSTEMEHLRLSSPQNDDSRQNEVRETCETSSETSSLQRDLNNAIDGIFHENCTGNSPLQTINEESLKQLLYGIDRKV